MKLTADEIEATRAAGIIDDAKADAMLSALGVAAVAEDVEEKDGVEEDAPLIGNEEDLRFLRSFSDIFITIGVALVMVGVFITATVMDDRESGWGMFAAAGAFWIGSEYFGRVRRAHLQTLVLALGFAIALFLGLSQFYADKLVTVGSVGKGWFVPAALFLLGMLAYYWRMRLPFCMSLLAWGSVVFVFGVAGSLGILGGIWSFIIVGLVCAVAVEAVALVYDRRDHERVMRFSDNAFWLHAVASPLLFVGLLAAGTKLIVGAEFEGGNVNVADLLPRLEDSVSGMSVWVAGLVLLAILWGLAVNRRVFVISTLVWSVALMLYLLGRATLDPTLAFSFSLLAVGAMVVFLGVGWHPARKALLKVLPNWRIFPRVTGLHT